MARCPYCREPVGLIHRCRTVAPQRSVVDVVREAIAERERQAGKSARLTLSGKWVAPDATKEPNAPSEQIQDRP